MRRDLIDDGQFGQAYLLSAFNYSQGMVEGIEFKAKFTMGNFTLYSNWSMGFEKATTVVSNQSFFAPDELALSPTTLDLHRPHAIADRFGGRLVPVDGTNTWVDGTKLSSTMIYGSGLRQGFANTDHVPAYTQVNLGVST